MPRARAWAAAGGSALIASGLLWLVASRLDVVTSSPSVASPLTGPGIGPALGAAGHAWLWWAALGAPALVGALALVRRRAGPALAVVSGALAGSLVAGALVVAGDARAYAALNNQGGAAIAPSVVSGWATGPAVAWAIAAAVVGAAGAFAVTVAWATREPRP